MATVSSTSGIVQQAPTTGDANDLRSVDVDQFLELLLTELQNQDPLDPMDNSEMLQQLSQIREISATNELSDTLASVLLGQNINTASSLIGKRVSALSDDARNIEGIVDRVSIEKDDTNQSLIRVHIGDDQFDVNNIREIVG